MLEKCLAIKKLGKFSDQTPQGANVVQTALASLKLNGGTRDCDKRRYGPRQVGAC